MLLFKTFCKTHVIAFCHGANHCLQSESFRNGIWKREADWILYRQLKKSVGILINSFDSQLYRYINHSLAQWHLSFSLANSKSSILWFRLIDFCLNHLRQMQKTKFVRECLSHSSNSEWKSINLNPMRFSINTRFIIIFAPFFLFGCS